MSIGARLRFEILKRDGFRCQYCGAGPSSSLLAVDHVEPVSRGGTDDPVNLITACTTCNGGKSNVRLDESQIDTATDAEELSERAAQVRAYLESLRELEGAKGRLQQHYVNKYCDMLGTNAMPKAIAVAFVRLDEELGAELLGSAIAAVGEWSDRLRYVPNDTKQAKYFFGVVRNTRERRARS